MKQFIRNVKVVGTGSHVPPAIVTNEYLEALTRTNDEWIQKTLGIKERRVVEGREKTSDLASIAGLKAIADTNVSVKDIDLIIVATATPDCLAPSTACIVQNKIGAHNAVCFDLAAVCSGFLFSMSTAAQFIANNVYNNALVIGADTFSTITDWSRRDCVFFGDGAGAAILSHAKDGEGFLAFRLYSDGRGADNFVVPRKGSQFFHMNGKAVYNTATTVLPLAINQVLEDTGLSIDDVDYLIPHQPGINVLRETAKIINLPFEKVMTNMHRYANTAGGTIPILLDEVNKSGKLTTSKIVLFAAVGSGWTWGASVIKWA